MPQFFRATDGEHATNFLLRHGAFSDAPRTDLVVLDLNLPATALRCACRNQKSNPQAARHLCCWFSTSAQLYDRERSLEMEYVEKGQFRLVRQSCGTNPPEADFVGR